MSTSEAGATSAPSLPEYAPVPQSSLGPAVNAQGYYVGQVERNLYWVTDGVYQCAFLTTPDGVILFDAPATIGHNIQRAVDEIASANGVSNKVSYLVHSHHHADHGNASALFGTDVVRIGHEETRNLMLRDNDPNRPAPEETFQDSRTLEIGGERIELGWHGASHSPDTSFIYFPNHDTLMLVDVINVGWVPIYSLNLATDVPGYIAAPGVALDYAWTHLVSGHMGRLGSRDDVALHQQFVGDLVDSIKQVFTTFDPTVYYQSYWPNMWASVSEHLDEVCRRAIRPVMAKYTGKIAAADDESFVMSTAVWILESLRLDLGLGIQVHS
jgi:glyoxylase-like metal-dependent hydrolase (beta-lactamase superfamily II)